MQAVSPDNRVTGAICQYSASNLVIDKHDPYALVGAQEDDPVSFQGPSHLVARAFVDPEIALGFQ
ncbi:hypothetical protein, partial [Klebsiella pneumoniae]|uniref:hypothetical protein n=1 Tax=Klebsiella pneumoniae TaxID=573 RepID=UPI001953E339